MHDLEYSVAIVAFIIIELKFNLLKRFQHSIGDFFGHPYQRIWALSLPFLAWFWLSLVFFVHYNENIMLLRVFNIGGTLGTGHWFIWLGFAFIATRYGWNNIIQGGIIIGLVAAIHEIAWYIFYYLVYPSETALAFLFYLPFIILCLVFIAAYFALSQNGSIVKIPSQTLVEIVAVVVVFDALWAIAGFPVTVDLVSGGTGYFYSLPVNLIENDSWIMPILLVLISGASTMLISKIRKPAVDGTTDKDSGPGDSRAPDNRLFGGRPPDNQRKLLGDHNLDRDRG